MAGHNLATLASNQFTPKLKADRQDTTARPREGVHACRYADAREVRSVDKSIGWKGGGQEGLVIGRQAGGLGTM